MTRLGNIGCLLVAVAAGLIVPQNLQADQSFAEISKDVNRKMVKIFGVGGIRGLASYGTGTVISEDGYILTVNSHILDTDHLRVHLYDGTRYFASVVAREPELDIALVKVDSEDPLRLPYFDISMAKTAPPAEAGTGILAFSNQFQIATRDEPLSVQRGRISAYAKLHGRIGIHEAPYTGDIYFVDAITNNPGAGGGALTDRKGRLLGLIGKELRNELTNTWVNYALPLQAKIELPTEDGKTKLVSIYDLIELKENYRPIDPDRSRKLGGGGYHGIVLVPDVVERTPPYVDDVHPESPAEKAGLKPDDLIVYVDGLPVPSIQMFNEMIEKYRPNSKVKLEVRRGDKLNTLSLTLATPPKRE